MKETASEIASDLFESVILRYLHAPPKLTKIIPHSRVYLDLHARRMCLRGSNFYPIMWPKRTLLLLSVLPPPHLPTITETTRRIYIIKLFKGIPGHHDPDHKQKQIVWSDTRIETLITFPEATNPLSAICLPGCNSAPC